MLDSRFSGNDYSWLQPASAISPGIYSGAFMRSQGTSEGFAMRKIKQKIETIVNSEEKSRFFSFGSFLFGFSLLYGGVVKLREIFYKKGIFRSKQLPCKVISVGNLTAGGTGKTPMTIYVAELLTHLGYKVAVVSRGYKGQAEKIGGVVSDGRTLLMSPDMAGDEPFMMAEILKDIPVVVAEPL